MTPERQVYFDSMTEEEYKDRVMVLYHKSCISRWKKKLTIATVKGYTDTIGLAKVMLRHSKRKLVKAKGKLPNRKVGVSHEAT